VAGLMQAAAHLVPDALEHDASGAGALLAAAPLSELAAGGQLHETVAGALGTFVAAAIRWQMCSSLESASITCLPGRP
jgi:hydroxymethylpyrimidine/phosphomethylpyrimidine kinase